MKFYIAAPFIYKTRARNLARLLKERAHRIMSQWIFSEEEEFSRAEDAALLATRDILGITHADIFVLLAVRPSVAVGSMLVTGDSRDSVGSLRAAGLTGGLFCGAWVRCWSWEARHYDRGALECIPPSSRCNHF